METVEFITYRRYKSNTESTDNSPGFVFCVPREWAEEKIKEMFEMTLSEFYSCCTWNHTEILYYQAEDDEVLL